MNSLLIEEIDEAANTNTNTHLIHRGLNTGGWVHALSWRVPPVMTESQTTMMSCVFLYGGCKNQLTSALQ